MPIIPDFTRLRQEGCYKFKAPVDYLVSAELVREDNGRPNLDILKKKRKDRGGRDRGDERTDSFTMYNYEYFLTIEKLKYYNKYLDYCMANLI